MKERF